MRKCYVMMVALLACLSCNNRTEQKQTGPFRFLDRLSDYHFFEGELKLLQPRKGVTSYELATPLFTDYAVKDRFIVLPADSALTYTGDGLPHFPDATFIIKNFAYTDTLHRKVMIETRLLYKDPYDHGWKVMNYLWNKEQTDADRWLMGKRVPITLLDDNGQAHTTNYQVPNTNDCKRCHINNSTLTPIGPKWRNLNFTRAGHSQNQLQAWAGMGLVKGLPDAKQLPALPVWNDSLHYSVNERARAYLDVNCAHCHIKGGDAFNTGLFLDYETTAKVQGVMKSPVSAGGGAGGLDYDIVPGDAANSILYYRMNSVEPGTAMPELARTLVHREGVELIAKWIDAMAGSR